MDKDKRIVVNFEGLQMETTLSIIEDFTMCIGLSGSGVSFLNKKPK
jgi:hypothetical protein